VSSSPYTSKTDPTRLHSQRLPSAAEAKNLFGSIPCNGEMLRQEAKKRSTDQGVKMQNNRIKWQAVVIAASGVVPLGALAAAISQEQTAIAQSGDMIVGQTTTSTTPPLEPPTSVARPMMKAQRPNGF